MQTRKPEPRPDAPVKPSGTTEDAGASRRERDPEERPRHAGDETGEHGDRMPLGADEPGAGL
jgi:hypothetical protein